MFKINTESKLLGYHETDFFYYEIESGEQYTIGDEVLFRKKRLYISEITARMDKGLLIYKYRLSRLQGIRRDEIYNLRLKGISLEGKVLDTKDELVKLHLNIDEEQPKEKASWYPFTPPTNNVMYCMPQIGTHASLYFPDATGNNAQVLGCVRKNGDNCPKTADPNIRYWGTEHGSELELSPSAINIVAGCKEPLKLSFDDTTGVTMTSHKKIILNAAGDITFKTPKRIIFSAPNQIVVKKTNVQSGFSIENEFHFLGANVILEGRDRTTYPPFNDKPKAGKPIITPPVSAKITPNTKEESKQGSGFNWGKLLVCAVAAVAVVAAVVVTVSTFGAGAVVGAALVGAAIGAIGGVVSTAASDIANHKASSINDYIGNAAKGALVGAVCGAIFGPLAGAGSAEASLIPKTAGQLAAGFAKTMSIGGAAGSTYYTLDQLVNDRMLTMGGEIEAFGAGALTAGAFEAAVPWISRAAGKINEMIPNRPPIVEDKPPINPVEPGEETSVAAAKGVGNAEVSRIDYLRSKYGQLTPKQINNRINLRGAVNDEIDRLNATGLSNNEMGPAVAGVLDTKTGKYYFGINNVNGDIPEKIHGIIEDRINNMPQEIKNGYIKTLGAGSHAEVNALNEALLNREDANLEDFMVYVVRSGKKLKPQGLPMPRCPHCEFITKGTKFFPEVLKYGK